MTKFKSSTSSTLFPSIWVIHFMNDAQLLNATGLGLLCTALTISPYTKI